MDPREAAIDKAIMAAKASNITEMEDALEEVQKSYDHIFIFLLINN